MIDSLALEARLWISSCDDWLIDLSLSVLAQILVVVMMILIDHSLSL